MDFIEGIKERAKKEIKKIVLPEASDIRTIKATATALKENYADIILIGDENIINKMAKDNNLDISKATITSPNTLQDGSKLTLTLKDKNQNPLAN